MASTTEALILDMLEWIGPNPRLYSEVIEAWRTSCPRLPVWEEANERGFLNRSHEQRRGVFVFFSRGGGRFSKRTAGSCSAAFVFPFASSKVCTCSR